ncbi:hypothetical protein [Sphingobacterium hotanense]|nr:hypothetical protein [Sphingobacterium hotanense]
MLKTVLSGQLAGFSAGEWAFGSNGWGKGYQNEYNMTTAFITETVLN